MIFVTDHYALNEAGRLCKMGGRIEADSLEKAQATAEALGHTVLGELVGEEEWAEGGDFCDSVQAERDREWLKGNGPA